MKNDIKKIKDELIETKTNNQKKIDSIELKKELVTRLKNNLVTSLSINNNLNHLLINKYLFINETIEELKNERFKKDEFYKGFDELQTNKKAKNDELIKKDLFERQCFDFLDNEFLKIYSSIKKEYNELIKAKKNDALDKIKNIINKIIINDLQELSKIESITTETIKKYKNELIINKINNYLLEIVEETILFTSQELDKIIKNEIKKIVLNYINSEEHNQETETEKSLCLWWQLYLELKAIDKIIKHF